MNEIKFLRTVIKDKTFIQLALNKQGFNLIVDGIIGPKSKKAFKLCNKKQFYEDINNMMYGLFIPQYLEIAFNEIGTKEIKGKKSNPSVEKYHDYAGIGWAKDDIPWCGSFIAYCMKKSCIDISNIKRPASSLSWLNFGREVYYPAYGSLAIKKRKGGGHITIVVGVSKNGKYCYCLGGNQNDMVKISKYRIDSFISFRLPFCVKEQNVIKDMNAKYANKEV